MNQDNAHVVDSLITFDEESHSYAYGGKPIKSSVTEIIKNYFESFNSKEIAEKMTKSADWPRVGYIHENGQPFSVEEIMAKWSEEGLSSRTAGTLMHENIENILNGVPILDESKRTIETRQFECFYQDIIRDGQITPYRTEWKICAPNISLAGSVDFVGQLPDKSFILIDWKRTKKAPFFFKYEDFLKSRITHNPNSPQSDGSGSTYNSNSSSSGLYYKKAKHPIHNLYDCDEIKYSLQLNFYNYILTNYYNMNVSKMMIVAFHPKLPNYIAFEVKNLQNEIHEIICHHISTNFAKND